MIRLLPPFLILPSQGQRSFFSKRIKVEILILYSFQSVSIIMRARATFFSIFAYNYYYLLAPHQSPSQVRVYHLSSFENPWMRLFDSTFFKFRSLYFSIVNISLSL